MKRDLERERPGGRRPTGEVSVGVEAVGSWQWPTTPRCHRCRAEIKNLHLHAAKLELEAKLTEAGRENKSLTKETHCAHRGDLHASP